MNISRRDNMKCSVIVILVSFVGLFVREKALAQLLEPECGLTGMAVKIMDGTNATHGAHPWMAYLYLNENKFQCGGTLIHKRFVLTAAHCIVNGESLSVRLGEYSSVFSASSAVVYQVTLAVRNRQYSRKQHINDIGMLRLHPEVQFNAHIRPICIFTDSSIAPPVSTYTATGWGTTRNDRVAKVLQTIELQDMDASNCNAHMGVHLTPGQICAGHPTGDTCSGDSGGPLGHVVNISGTRRYVQYGIVSYGNQRCISPGVYTRVPFYADWIVRIVQYGLTH